MKRSPLVFLVLLLIFIQKLLFGVDAVKIDSLKVDNRSTFPVVLNNIGENYMHTGKMIEALAYFGKLHDTHLIHKDKEGIISSYMNIGDLLQKGEDYKRATEVYKKGILLAEELGINVAPFNYRIGVNLFHQTKYDEALFLLVKSEPYFRKFNLKKEISHISRVIAQIQSEYGRNDWALDKAKEAFQFSIESGIDNEEGISLKVLALISYKEGKTNEGITYMEEAIKVLESTQNVSELADCYKALAAIYEGLQVAENQELAEEKYRALLNSWWSDSIQKKFYKQYADLDVIERSKEIIESPNRQINKAKSVEDFSWNWIILAMIPLVWGLFSLYKNHYKKA